MEAFMTENRTLPVVPLRGMMVFPYMIVHFDVGRNRSIAAIEEAMLKDRQLVVVAQKDETIDEPSAIDLYNIGTLIEIKQIFKMPGGVIRVLVEGLRRVEITGFHEQETYDAVDAAIHTDEIDTSLGMEALTRAVVHAFEKWVRLSRRIPPETMVSVTLIDDVGRLVDLIASHLNLKMETRQALLSCLDVKERVEKLYQVIEHELEMLKVEEKIGKRVRDQMEKVQKDFYLREQIKAIQKELGEDESHVEQIDRYRKQLEKGDYPDEVKKTIERELKRLNTLGNSNAAEAGVIRNYLDCLIELPWNVGTKDNVNIAKAAKVLDRDHYGLEKVKDRILDYLAVHQLSKDKTAPILCLVGPPGVGKTSLAASIARAMQRKFTRASLGGIRDEAEIRGHRRTYVGAFPGCIIDGLKRVGVKNPVFLLDEVDKLSSEYAGNPAAALLEVLDSAQNSTFKDHFVDLPFDLSKVLWIVTANNLAGVPRPLRDRMEIITLSSYTAYEKKEIAKHYLIARQRKENGLTAKDISFGAGVVEKIIQEYTRESGVRELERVIGRVCRKAARRIVEGMHPPIRVTKKNLREFLSRAKYLETKADKKPEIGVVTGMAWTEIGGDILPTEVQVLKGKGKLILTGQLGDVMQESAQAALSYIRSRADRLGLADDFYEKDDIHIHLPEGAVPKDGPSAGITMATAMISALTGKKARSDVAMTGEITLRGNVLPIGGLKEKVLAAYREGMKTIVLPKENERDIEEIPAIVREKLNFVPVSNMDEVLKIALIKETQTTKSGERHE